MEYIDRLQQLHWTVWGALGFSLGLGILLICMRLWDTLKGNRQGTLYQATFQQRLKEKETASKSCKVYISDAEAASEPVTGLVAHCSVSNISLRVADAVDEGTILTFRPIDLTVAQGWASVEVKKADRDGRYWKLGCRFIRTPPWVTRFLGQPTA
jgi:hypothetical protein